MIYITFNLEEKKFTSTVKSAKAVAYGEKYHAFANEDIDYAKSAVSLMNESLADKSVKLCYCKECKQPFFQKKEGILTNCPQHSSLSEAVAAVEG